jgi:hypothetical protein
MENTEKKSLAPEKFSQIFTSALPQIIRRKLNALVHDLGDELQGTEPGASEAFQAARIMVRLALTFSPWHKISTGFRPVQGPDVLLAMSWIADRMPNNDILTLSTLNSDEMRLIIDGWAREQDISAYVVERT